MGLMHVEFASASVSGRRLARRWTYIYLISRSPIWGPGTYKSARPPQAPSATRDDDPLAYCPGTIGCTPHPPPNAGGTCTLAPYAQTPPRFVHIIFTHHTPGFELLCASREGISIVRKLYGCMYVYTGELQARRDETGEKGRRIKCYSDPVNEREGQRRAREIRRR